MTEEKITLPHRVVLEEGKRLTVTGVTEVAGFEQTQVLLHTGLGSLTVEGTGLRLKTLLPEGGQVTVEGTVTALEYGQSRPEGGWLRRLLG